MKELLEKMRRITGIGVVEILAYIAIYYCLVHNTSVGSRPGAGMILPVVCLCIVIGNIILSLKTETLTEYVGKCLMITSVFAVILKVAVLYGCVPYASIRTILIVSATMALPIVSFKWIFKHMSEEQQDDENESGHYNFLGINMEGLRDEKKESQE